MIRFHTEALGMRVLKKRDFPEEKYSYAVLGFGPQESQFVLKLIYSMTLYRHIHVCICCSFVCSYICLNVVPCGLIYQAVQVLISLAKNLIPSRALSYALTWPCSIFCHRSWSDFM